MIPETICHLSTPSSWRNTRTHFYKFMTLSTAEIVMRNKPNSVGRFNDEVRIFASTNKILCLTERIDEILMWAYYAEGQAGVALRFRSAPEIDSLWGAAAPVLYLDEPPPLYDVETFSDVMSGRASLDRRKILEQLARTKATCWSHEREWRVFAGSGRDKDAPYEDIPFLPWELDAVIVGCKMSRHDKADIASIAQKRYPHARLYRAQPARGNFGLSFAAES